jgi:hypothetical protein
MGVRHQSVTRSSPYPKSERARLVRVPVNSRPEKRGNLAYLPPLNPVGCYCMDGQLSSN